jgi:ATP-dependent Clp protease ATP-binding subunit ClpX
MKTLQEFQEIIKKTVKGQDNAVNRLSTVFYKYLLKLYGRDYGCYFEGATSILLIGESGSGKTFLIKQASQLLNIPMIELVATSIAKDGGWAGESFTKQVAAALTLLPSDTSGAIIFIDEFDKLLQKNHTSHGDDFNKLIQQDLLKYIEGITTEVKDSYFKSGMTIDFNKCVFVFAGVFDGLYEKSNSIGFLTENQENKEKILDAQLMKLGLIQELCGRIQEKIELNKIDDNVYKEILENEEFVLYKWREVLKRLDISIEIDYDKAIQEARKSDLGVRGLINYVEKEVSLILQNNIEKVNINQLNPLSYKPYNRE